MKELVKCYTWSASVCGGGTWTLMKLDQKYLEGFEMCCWRRRKKMSWTDRVKTEEVLHRVKEGRNTLCALGKGRLTGLVETLY
jgi:hypothetical protein